MRRWIVPAVLSCLAAGPAFADVSSEVIVGLEGDSTSEAKQTIGGVEMDIADSLDTSNTMFVAQYTHFFEPLRDDGTPIDLRAFLQHPSFVFVGLAAFSQTGKNSLNPLAAEEDRSGGSMLVVGGQYFFPTNTGLFLTLGGGGGTMEQAGTEQSTKQGVALLGTRGVIKNTVGLFLEAGEGKRNEKEMGFADKNFDVGELSLGAAVFAGNQLSFELDLEVEGLEQTGLPAGAKFDESTGRWTLSVSYWFDERFGLSLPLYSETNAQKTTVGGLETKQTVTNNGMDLFAAFRF